MRDTTGLSSRANARPRIAPGPCRAAGLFRGTFAAVSFVAIIASAPAALAHGPIHEQIARVTRLIESEPGDASLYAMRAGLYRVDADFAASLADLDRAASLDAGIESLDRERGRTLFEAGRLREAGAALDRAIARRPDDSLALLARARTRAALGDAAAAVLDYDALLAHTSRPLPEYWLERARTIAALGPGSIDRAIASLDEARSRSGFLIVLEEAALEMEIRAKRYDAALVRLDRIAPASPRRERWDARRGDVLTAQGRFEDARAAYERALADITRLPAPRREARIVHDLEAHVRTALEKLQETPQ